MIDAARKRLPGIAFEVADIRQWRPEQRFDVILANAVLQWIPGHETLVPALTERLTPGGALAVQMPDNLDEPSHRLMREVAGAGPWAAKLKDAAKARAERHDAGWYFRLLRAHASHVDVWRTTTTTRSPAPHAVVEWVKGTGLRPFLDPLDESEREAYLARYEAAIAEAYPAEGDGTVLCHFRGCSLSREVTRAPQPRPPSFSCSMRIADPFDHRLDHPSAACAHDVAERRVQSNVGLGQRLLDALNMPRLLARQLLASSCERAQFLPVFVGNEARLDQAMGGEIGDPHPLGVGRRPVANSGRSAG